MSLYVTSSLREFQRRIHAALRFHGLRRNERLPALKRRGIPEGVL